MTVSTALSAALSADLAASSTFLSTLALTTSGIGFPWWSAGAPHVGAHYYTGQQLGLEVLSSHRHSPSKLWRAMALVPAINSVNTRADVLFIWERFILFLN